MSVFSELVPGTVFARDFRIVRKLGAGGMGALYVAEQLSTGRQRALKLMHPGLVGSPELREKFALEARVGAKIASEHVIEVVAAGVSEDVPWLAMELLVGEDLEHEIRARGRFEKEDLVAILGQVCHALGAAHEAGIVHRDLKPDNVLLAETRRMNESFTVKLLDFGIAKVVEAARSANTGAVGTPLWMAPEQTERNAEITPGTDVWALGLLAFVMLTGKPFWLSAASESGVATILREVVLDPIPSATERARALGVEAFVPRGFDAWFARCVVREPSRRFSNAHEAARALADALGVPSRTIGGPVRISVSSSEPERRSDTEIGVARTVGTPAPEPVNAAHGIGQTVPLDPRTGPVRPTEALVEASSSDAPAPSVEEPAPSSALAPQLPISKASPLGVGLALVGVVVLVAAGAFAVRGRTTSIVEDASVPGEAGVTGAPFCPREMARVLGGELVMGSEADGPPHPVKVAPFCVDLTEVTAGDYAACVARKACPPPTTEAAWPDLLPAAKKGWSDYCTYGKKDKLDHPMNCVTFEEAAAFCRQAGKRLPDEAQWEYAARGTDGRPYPWGREPPTPTRLNACDDGCAKIALGAETEVIGARLGGDDGADATSTVGRYLQGVSPFGAFDLAGNVAEWVDATYCPYGQGSCGSSARVVRGGSWTTLRPYALTATSRSKAAPSARMPDVGFRCVE